MTVKELIKQLSKAREDIEVRIDYLGDVIDIDKVDLEGDEDGIYIIGGEE